MQNFGNQPQIDLTLRDVSLGTVSGGLAVAGDLTVSGTTTTVHQQIQQLLILFLYLIKVHYKETI